MATIQRTHVPAWRRTEHRRPATVRVNAATPKQSVTERWLLHLTVGAIALAAVVRAL